MLTTYAHNQYLDATANLPAASYLTSRSTTDCRLSAGQTPKIRSIKHVSLTAGMVEGADASKERSSKRVEAASHPKSRRMRRQYRAETWARLAR